MTLTPTLFDPATAAARCEMAQDFADAGAWIACDLGAEIPPDMTIQVPAPRGLDHEGKLDWLRMVARSWKTDPRPDGQGGEIAERRFGHLRFTASVRPEFATMTDLHDAARARRARHAKPEGGEAA